MSARRIVVIGSGAAGLVAALAARRAGAAVTLLERATLLGGSTAISGGVAWLPGNHVGDLADDDAEKAGVYLRRVGLGDLDPVLVDAFLLDAPRMARWLEEETRLRWELLDYPDYHQAVDGAVLAGRSIEPAPLTLPPEVGDRLRSAPYARAPLTYGEILRGDVDEAELRSRLAAGTWTRGGALVGALVEAALGAGVEMLTGVRAGRLLTGVDGVVGVSAGAQRFAGAVVLASGGFERDPALVRAFLRGPMDLPVGVGTLEGDGLRMAMTAGAELGNMSEAWWVPAMAVPGEEIDGQPLNRLLLRERALPHSVMVDSRGRRFTNEAQNYNDLGRELQSFDAATMGFPRVPSWLVVDRQFRDRYPLASLLPGHDDPDWLVRADNLVALAERIGVDPNELSASIERFNLLVAKGEDSDFGRGRSEYDRYVGDAAAPHPNLGTVSEPPYYAVEVRPGCLATKGGPRTDERSQVVAADGSGPIPRLYAAGNAAASPFGFAYPGAGGTIGPALVFGLRAGEAAAEDVLG